MSITKTAVALTIGALFSVPAWAQDADDIIQRNARQQERIEQGLRSGDITVREAARLEQQASRIERYQSRALSDGTLSQDEARRIDRVQDRFGREIHRQGHDAEIGNPNSPSARRMAADVDRNGDEQRRIAQGLRSGDLTNREAARLERGQSYVNRNQARAGADGRIDRHEQRDIRHTQNHQSQNIWRERHDGQRGDRGWHAPRHAQGGDHPAYNGQHRGWNNDRGANNQAGWNNDRRAHNQAGWNNDRRAHNQAGWNGNRGHDRAAAEPRMARDGGRFNQARADGRGRR